MTSRHFLILSFAALSACATGPTPYGPSPNGALGFENTKIESDRFRVKYTARSEEEARNFALLRAAQLTAENGYDWFEVVGGNMSGDPEAGRRIGTSVGVGVGSGYGRRGYRGSSSSVGVGININDAVAAFRGPKVTSAIEIIMGRGERPDRISAYNAAQVQQNIRPEVFN